MSSGRDDEQRMLEIEKVSFELDDYFVALANKYELTVSALNGIMMARLLRLNVEARSGEPIRRRRAARFETGDGMFSGSSTARFGVST